MPLKHLIKAKHTINLVIIYSAKTFSKLTFKFFINIVITIKINKSRILTYIVLQYRHYYISMFLTIY
jgi:hypothetical protein